MAEAVTVEREETVRTIFGAFNRHDADAALALSVPDCVMDWSRSLGPQQGVYEGHAGVQRWMDDIWESFEAFDVTPAELITGLITDAGVLRAPYGPAIASVV